MNRMVVPTADAAIVGAIEPSHGSAAVVNDYLTAMVNVILRIRGAFKISSETGSSSC